MRYALVFLLAGPVLAGDLSEARAKMEAQLKAGDELHARGDLDGALEIYLAAVATYREAVAKEEGRAAEAEGAAKAPEAAPADDGTPEGRKRVIAYYMKLLGHETDDVRYNAVAQLGEMRAVEARDALLAILAKDKYQVARRAAAWALGRLGKEGAPAIPALIREIGGESPLLAYMCEGALKEITEASLGQAVSMGLKTDMTPAERLEIQKKWQAWLDANRGKLAIPAEKVEEKVEKPEELPPEKVEEKPVEPEPAAKEPE